MTARVVLASLSESRKIMLRAAGVAFEAAAPDVDEDALKRALLAKGAGTSALAQALADAKALGVRGAVHDALVLGADQILDCGGRIFGKVASQDEARATLRALKGRTHRLISAAALARNGEIVWRHSDSAELSMREFSGEFLESYLSAEGEAILGSAGCYRIEGRGAQLFERVSGDYFTIRGLPLLNVLAALRDLGALAR